MSVLPRSAYSIRMPNMLPLKLVFVDDHLADVPDAVRREILSERIRRRVRPGQSVAVLVGSRGIAELSTIVKVTIDCIKELGARPFLVPAMGSHGGGVAEAQAAILAGYGIDQKRMGVPVKSAMDTVVIGQTPSGVDVHMDKYAYEADAVVPVGRIKPHTDFRGSIESGLCKMLAIGCGKHNGCSTLHRQGFDQFHELIPEVAEVFLRERNIAFGVAIVENAHDRVHTVKAIPGNRFLDEEPPLLELAKSLMPRLPFSKIDVLIVDEIGKDITGAGMDPNIMGRISRGIAPGYTGPDIQRIVVLGLSEGTHGNAIGIGAADYTVRGVLDAIDAQATFANCIASCDPGCGALPIALDSEEEAIRAAIQTCYHIDRNCAKVVRIKNTLNLVDIMVSESLYETCKGDDRFAVPESAQMLANESRRCVHTESIHL